MEIKALAQAHQESCRSLAQDPLEAVLLWYADLGLEVDEEQEEVLYHCPRCGGERRLPTGLFLLLESNARLLCVGCGGDPADRGGE
jgi:hypothetical protein